MLTARQTFGTVALALAVVLCEVGEAHTEDLFWWHRTAGALARWYLDGATRIGGATLTPNREPDVNWQVVGVADFNGDGKPDLLWQHRTAGDLAVWYLDGATRIGGATLTPNREPDVNWQVVGVADFNGDGKPDLLWQHRTAGDLAVWYLDGATRIGGATLTPNREPDVNWQVVGVADFNGDGKPDLLWQHQLSGAVAVWHLDGVQRTWAADVGATDPTWQVVGVADFNGDGKPDLLWQHQTAGYLAVWYLDGAIRIGGATLTPNREPDVNWRIVGTFTTGASGPSLGQWSGVLSWPLVAINVTLLRTGQVLVWDGGMSVGDPPTHGGLTAQLWNPQTQTFTPVPTSRTNLFCSSSCALPDGRIFVAGGADPNNYTVGISHANVFNPGTGVWSAAPSMAYRRWYPTATCLPDGRVLVTSGSQFSDHDWILVPEVYNPSSNTWTQLNNAAAAVPFYPHVFVLPDGRVLYASTFQQPYASDILNVQNQTRTLVDNLLLDGGSAVMYRPGKILKSGTAAANNGSTEASGAAAYVLDMTAPVPTWRQTNSMHFPRSYHTLTVLPDGTVLVTGGGMTKDSTDVADAVYDAEIWSPQTETWTTVSRMQRPRLYHSTALLLPDGRVLVAGGGRNSRSSLKELNAEIYSPPYLFNGPRPTITAIPSSVAYGSNLTVQTPNAATITSVALLRPGSITHGFDQEQRFIPLTFQQATGALTVQAPANANLAPPGYYMLFILNSSGVPSVASFIRVGP